jgi:hypothetical protein
MPKPNRFQPLQREYQAEDSPFLHQGLAERAEREGSSLNQYMTAVLARSVGWESHLPEKKRRGRKTDTTTNT